jgi:hypothetical protein
MKSRFVSRLASMIMLSALFAGCAAGAVSQDEDEDEDVGEVDQALPMMACEMWYYDNSYNLVGACVQTCNSGKLCWGVKTLNWEQFCDYCAAPPPEEQ